ncbi:MAG: hypothetical protein WCA39_02030 [Nitrososphaeraceae archaeon]
MVVAFSPAGDVIVIEVDPGDYVLGLFISFNDCMFFIGCQSIMIPCYDFET